MSKTTKTFVFILATVMLISTGFVALAETTTPEQATIDQETEEDESVSAEDLGIEEPSVLPGHPFYFLKNWGRGIRSFFTFDKVKKVELKLKYASEQLLETRKLAWQNKKPEIIEKAIAKYQEAVENVKQAADKIEDNASSSPAVNKFLDKFTQKEALHMRILDKLATKNMATSTIQRITEAKDAQLKRFEEVMLKLEVNKERIGERLEANLEALKQKLPNKAEVLDKLEGIKNRMVEKITGLAKPICISMWEPVCGTDDKTYTNKCWAEQAGVEITQQGICQNSIVPNTGQLKTRPKTGKPATTTDE